MNRCGMPVRQVKGPAPSSGAVVLSLQQRVRVSVRVCAQWSGP